jgi:hypothetical protein
MQRFADDLQTLRVGSIRSVPGATQEHASDGLVQALLDAGANDRPALASPGIAREVAEAAVELDHLRLGERQLAGLGGDAVPEMLPELDPLGYGGPAEAKSLVRMASAPQSALPDLQVEAGHARELAHVACDHCETVRDAGRGEPEVCKE